MYHKLLFLLASILSSSFAFAQISPKAQAYIDSYKNAAILNMARHGVPASITLAQGMLESGYGESKLARTANNHFGIKCGNWNGKKTYASDDRPNECFRKYSSVADSYEDHSLFLAGKERYSTLFDLKRTDYKGWAYGLKEAGYATNAKYPELLIKLIEQYNLNQFDKESPNTSASISQPSFIITEQNGLPAYRVREGDNLNVIATALAIPLKKILLYNELGENDQPQVDQIIYLKRKRNRAAKEYSSHRVENGETLFDIAHKYGMNYEALLYLNRLSFGSKLTEGQIIQLRNRAPRR